MAPVRLAVVGLPELAETRYLPALVTLDEVELLAAVDPDPVRSAWVCDRYPIAHGYASVPAMLEAVHPDAAVVLEPPERQADAAIPLLRAGAPVLCDRPLGHAFSSGDRHANDFGFPEKIDYFLKHARAGRPPESNGPEAGLTVHRTIAKMRAALKGSTPS